MRLLYFHSSATEQKVGCPFLQSNKPLSVESAFYWPSSAFDCGLAILISSPEICNSCDFSETGYVGNCN